MAGREAAAAWRLFEINWLMLAGMAVVLAAAVMLSGFSFQPEGAVVSYGFVAVYAAFAYYNAKAPHRRDPQVVYVLGATAQLVFATIVLAPLSYIAASANLPLQDANLYALDRALGLDWKAYVTFVNAHPLLADWLGFGYTMIQWPIFLIPVVLCAAHEYRRLQEFILAFTLALIVTVVISIFVPAIGVFHHLDLPPSDFANLNPAAYLAQLKDLPLVRDGSLRRLELFGLAGLVAFPSFHAASAALYAWAFWSVRWFRPIAVISNVMMFAATPIDGGHYFVDLFGGVAVAVLVIAAARWASRRLADSSSQHSVRVPASAADVPVSAAHTRSSP